MKRCFKCGAEKPLEAFYAHSQMADGRLNKCIDCAKIDARRHRITKSESVREYDRQRNSDPKRKAERDRRFQEFKRDYPERRAAHMAVANAVRNGRLKKGSCIFCGAGDRVEAHHHDYSKPLDVTWLCRACHSRFHALEQMATYREDAA